MVDGIKIALKSPWLKIVPKTTMAADKKVFGGLTAVSITLGHLPIISI